MTRPAALLFEYLSPPLPRSALLLAALTFASLAATGATIYKSVDANGSVRYSDQPPAGNSAVEEIELPDGPPVTVPDTGSLIEQMAATTARLKEDRLEREKERQPPASTMQPSYYPQPEQERQSYPQPWPWGYDTLPNRGKHHHHTQREPPDLRNQRDRGRDEKEGTWYVPKRLPGLGPSRR